MAGPTCHNSIPQVSVSVSQVVVLLVASQCLSLGYLPPHCYDCLRQVQFFEAVVANPLLTDVVVANPLLTDVVVAHPLLTDVDDSAWTRRAQHVGFMMISFVGLPCWCPDVTGRYPRSHHPSC